MITEKILISGTGCALADFLYSRISFDSPEYKRFLSEKSGDGGLSPGKLVFTEELEKFAGRPVSEIIRHIIGDRDPDAFNVGGPSLVSMIHVSQMLDSNNFNVKFFGITGTDSIANQIFDIVHKMPLNVRNYITNRHKATPFTFVLSDPSFQNGEGERSFINNIGAAWDYFPEQLNNEFFDSHIVCFGGTALVPQIHDNLSVLLQKARQNNSIAIVNTVFDFRNEGKNPGKPWPLVSENKDYSLIDLLIMNSFESLRISGKESIQQAIEYFVSAGVSSFIITDGANDIFAWSNGKLFKKTEILKLPVSRKITEMLNSESVVNGDTTGCGDNFVGGVITSVARQLQERKKGDFDLTEALSWGVASGGFSCFTIGGTYIESYKGEKRNAIEQIQKAYLEQINLICEIL